MLTGGGDLANRLIASFFTLFKMILEGHIGRAASTAKQQEAKAPAKDKGRHRDRQVCSMFIFETVLLRCSYQCCMFHTALT